MPVLDYDPGTNPKAAGTLSFYKEGEDPSTGFQVTSEGEIIGLTLESISIDSSERAAFLKTTSSTEHAATVYQAGTSGVDTASALNIICDNPESSTVQVTGSENNRGTIKISHRNDSGSATGDANAAAISIDLKRDGAPGTAAQGIFITSTDGGTTGRLLLVRNGGANLVTIPAAGTLHTSVGAFGEALPVNHGLAGWTYPPEHVVNSSLLTGGTVYLSKVHVSEAVTISKLYWWVTAAGATPTAGQNHVGLYASDGTLLGSAGVDADISSTGLKTTTITGEPLEAGTFVWVAMVFNAATPPSVGRTTGNAGIASAVNVGLTSSTYRFATNGAGATALAASIAPGSNVATGFAGPWAAIGA